MKPQTQTIIDGENGDCLRACLASLLELDIKDVPLQDDKKTWPQLFFYNDWLAQFNLQLAYIPFGSMPFPIGYSMVSVPSACFEKKTHCVIAHYTELGELIKIVWNPNPQDPRGTNIDIKTIGYFYVLAVLDPAEYLAERAV